MNFSAQSHRWNAIDLSPIVSLMPSAFFPVTLVLLLALLGSILWWTWRHRAASTGFDTAPITTSTIANRATVTARPFLTKTEAHVFNLVQLVVRDLYLVFAKIPLLTLISITDDDEITRRTILRTIRSIRADIVLVHPGTLLPIKVIIFSLPGTGIEADTEEHRLVEAVLKAAGIERISLDPSETWTLSALAGVLGIEEESL